MPELPEVHALASDLGARLSGRIIERVDAVSFAAVKTFDPPLLLVVGRTIDTVTRHGKFLDICIRAEAATGPLHLIVHLAKAGWIRWRDGPPANTGRPGRGPLAARLVLRGDGGQHSSVIDGSGLDITEAGTKKSLAIYLVRNPADVPGIARLGPDPLEPEFTEEIFANILHSAGRAQVKGVLREQSNIAGIGNAYSDEILHAAKMSPFKPASMSPDEISRLYAAVQGTLRSAVARADGLAASELKKEKKTNLRVHGRAGEECPACGDTVAQVRFADSTLEYCPTCQTGGKPLADRVLSRLLR